MFITDELVSLTVYEERWASDLGHDVDVPEPIIDDILQHVASLLPDNVTNRHERAHQEQGTGRAQRCNQAGRS